MKVRDHNPYTHNKGKFTLIVFAVHFSIKFYLLLPFYAHFRTLLFSEARLHCLLFLLVVKGCRVVMSIVNFVITKRQCLTGAIRLRG